MPVGYAHTREGAAAAATNYVQLPGDDRDDASIAPFPARHPQVPLPSLGHQVCDVQSAKLTNPDAGED